MKIFKYILIAAILFILWVTEPLWFKKSYNVQEPSAVDTFVSKQDQERKKFLKAEIEKGKSLEEKFGPKPSVAYGSRVPRVLATYWKETLKYPDSLTEDICEPIYASTKGWELVCRYKVKNSAGKLELRQDTYTINHGVIIK